MELWRRAPEDHMQEILDHAATQKEGEDLVAVGGMHTSEAIKNVMALIEDSQCPNPELTDIPESWSSWPCIAYFFEDALPDHWQELVALGNIDNESLALQVSYVDKLIKLRELLLLTFGTVENYKKTAQDAKRNKKDKTAFNKMEMFRDNVTRALQVQVGVLGHMLSIVAHDDVTWGLYLRILNRDTKAPVVAGTKKDGSRKAPATPMKSANDLIPFLNLPTTKLRELFTNVIEGYMSWKAAKEVAEQYNCKTRLLREIESMFNRKSGVTNPTRAKNQGKWISYSQIVEVLPDVPHNLEVWRVPFGKPRLNAVETQNFESFIDRMYEAYQDAKKGRRRVAVHAVPKQFMVGMVKEQQQKEGDKRWAAVEALGGATNAALVINDRTENLKKYLRTKDSKFGKFLFSAPFVVTFILFSFYRMMGWRLF